MFWAGERIAAAIERNQVVEGGFDPDRLDCNAYSLSVGNEYFVTTDRKDRNLPLSGVQPFLGEYSRSVGMIIPSGQFAFLLTKEVVAIPRTAMGFISLKTKAAKFKGLVNVSGFHVDPGYRGMLVFAVFNAGPAPVHIRYGEPLFNLWVADISTGSEINKETLFFYKKKPILNIPSDIVTEVADRLESIKDISRRVETIEIQIRAVIIVGLLLSFVLGLPKIFD